MKTELIAQIVTVLVELEKWQDGFINRAEELACKLEKLRESFEVLEARYTGLENYAIRSKAETDHMIAENRSNMVEFSERMDKIIAKADFLEESCKK